MRADDRLPRVRACTYARGGVSYGLCWPLTCVARTACARAGRIVSIVQVVEVTV